MEKFKKRENIYSKQLSTHFNILRFRRNNHLACGAGRTYFSITADGSIFACTHFINDKKHAIGNIADGVIDKSKYEPIAIEKIKECANCWAKYFCLGHCPAQKISMGKSNISACPENECELEKLQVELYIKLFYYAKKYLPKSSKK